MEVRGETFHLSAVCAGQRQLSAFGCCTPELEPSPHPAEMTGKIKKNFWPCCERGRYGRDSTEQLGILKATQMAECIILPKICRIFHRLLWKYSVKINNPVSFYFPKESSRNSAAVSWRKTNKQPTQKKQNQKTTHNKTPKNQTTEKHFSAFFSLEIDMMSKLIAHWFIPVILTKIKDIY